MLKVDGCVAVCLVGQLCNCGAFTEEADERCLFEASLMAVLSTACISCCSREERRRGKPKGPRSATGRIFLPEQEICPWRPDEEAVGQNGPET